MTKPILQLGCLLFCSLMASMPISAQVTSDGTTLTTVTSPDEKNLTIDGSIGANGGANLFLINPAGIILGQNARLDLDGSFLGSTADRLLFPEGEFSAVNLDNPPWLTINAPIGLGFRDEPAPITKSSLRGAAPKNSS